ncbi:hypothetical protein TCAL_04635 [Tigriopus californicus]|uniref:Uncharacterized protein n=1 Tax=Tigriopus californicus TaxID=6832 RepID=A0A553NB69_TIGCA|nr:ankyrin repeat and protein kinase domain-containing protein 1-like [Tigriopus californicus]TRY62668.1 hypothetical protein TCAL_04635 [Tigriopus californicus]
MSESVFDLACDNNLVEVVNRINGCSNCDEIVRLVNQSLDKVCGWTPLHGAAQGGHPEMVKLLLSNGAKVDALTDTDYTPLHLAASGGHEPIVDILLQNQADPNISTTAGLNGTALHYAAGKGHEAIVSKLISHSGCNINQLSDDCCTPLYYAVLGNHANIVADLIHAKATVNDSDCEGTTPLHGAAQFGLLPIVKMLIEAGADKAAKDRFNRTPEDLAKEMAQKRTLEYFRSLH